jgi:hypothetical protein
MSLFFPLHPGPLGATSWERTGAIPLADVAIWNAKPREKVRSRIQTQATFAAGTTEDIFLR